MARVRIQTKDETLNGEVMKKLILVCEGCGGSCQFSALDLSAYTKFTDVWFSVHASHTADPLSRDCPFCGAKKGRRCTTLLGRKASPHKQRCYVPESLL